LGPDYDLQCKPSHFDFPLTLSMSTTILGINAYHGDASAALVVDGQLVAAVEEERFNRIKHWAGFPAESIRWCLEAGGVRAADLDHVAISFDPRANLLKRVGFVLRNRPSLGAVVDRLKRQGKTLALEDQFAAAVNSTGSSTTRRMWRRDF
jgi:carbamoyltransferase